MEVVYVDKTVDRTYVAHDIDYEDECFDGCDRSYIHCPECCHRTLYAVRDGTEDDVILYQCNQCHYVYFCCGECYDAQPHHIALLQVRYHHNWSREMGTAPAYPCSTALYDVISSQDANNMQIAMDNETTYVVYKGPRHYVDLNKLALTGPEGGYNVGVVCSVHGTLQYVDK